MKKIMILVSILLFVFSASAFATSGLLTNGTEVNDATSGDIIAKLSSSVDLAFNTTVDSYAIATKHAKGPKAYGSASGDTKIYFQVYNDTDLAATDMGASDSSVYAAGTGWSEM